MNSLAAQKHFFFWNAESKSPSWASPNWALLTGSWNPGLAAAKGSSWLWLVPMFVLLLMWDNSFEEFTQMKIINTNTAHSPTHFCHSDKIFGGYWVGTFVYLPWFSCREDWKVPAVISYNTINVYLQKWKRDMTPMKTVSLLAAGV